MYVIMQKKTSDFTGPFHPSVVVLAEMQLLFFIEDWMMLSFAFFGGGIGVLVVVEWCLY